MTTPSLVRACAERLARAKGALDERVDRVDVNGIPTDALLAKLRGAAEQWKTGGFGEITVLNSVGETVDLSEVHHIDGEIRLVIRKRSTASTCYLLTPKAVLILMQDAQRAAEVRRVLVAEKFETFRTVSCQFESWVDMVADEAAPNRLHHVVPRRIVRDQVAKAPLSVGPLLLERAPAASATFEAWRAAATSQLLIALCNEIWSDDGVLKVALFGPRTRRLPAELAAIDPKRDFEAAHEAASWVFDSGRDIETRHTLFTYELAREWKDNEGFALGFATRAAGAMEAAKSAFRMHVQESSKDTLKSLSDLRKTLAEEVSKIVAQTYELITAMSRDFIVALTVILGRIALLFANPEAGNSPAVKLALGGTAVFLAFSLITKIESNADFTSIAVDYRTVWKTKLYGFLDDDDFKRLAEDPLANAMRVYDRTEAAVAAAYIVVIAALVLGMFWSSSG